MKLTDFSLIFSIFFICILTRTDIKNDLLYDNTVFNVMYNACMDEITINSLEASFYRIDENGNPIIDKEILVECYKSEISILRADTNLLKEISDDSVVLVLTENNGYYIYTKSGWSEKILYENDEHLKKVLQIEDTLERKYAVKLLLATNDGEKFKNSIDDYSLIAVYKSKTLRIGSSNYTIYSVSGAAIVKNEKNYSTKKAMTSS